MSKAKEVKKSVTTAQAILLIVISIAVVILGLTVVKTPKPILLMVDGAIITCLAVLFGIPYKAVQTDIVGCIKAMIVPILIVLCVGMMVGAWMISGTVPVMIYYGMKLISPSVFFFMACLICAVMSLVMGSSWGTVSTVGIAFMGMAAGLNISLPITAGAIVSGALFGDKLSPLSDSPVLSSAITETNIFEGIRHAAMTTGPALLLSLVFYLVMGMHHATGVATDENYSLILNTLEKTFHLNMILLLPPVLVFILIMMKKPTLPVFAAGIVSAGILAVLFQGADFNSLTAALNAGYTNTTDVAIVDSMLKRGGMNGMLGTAALLIASGVFGGPLRAAGVVDILLEQIERVAKTWKSMAMGVLVVHAGFLVITGSYDVSYTVVGQMARDLFDKYNLQRKNLMRILLDTGVGFAPLIPWSVMGVFIANTLSVPTTTFLLYSPLLWLSPLICIIYILTGFSTAKIDPEK